MKISVIIAAYHGEAFIADQLNSLFCQTLVPDEILIGDDSGDTKTIEEINRIRNHFSGDLRIIRNPVRLGIIQNYRNLALEATGDVIFFSDQDDYWKPEKIATMVKALEKHPEKMVVVCNSEVTNEKLESRQELLLDRTPAFYDFVSRLEQGTWESFQDIFMQKFNFSGHNMAMRKEILDLFAEIPDDYLYHDIWLAQIASLAGKLLYVDEALTLYRQHGNNASGQLIKHRNKIREWLLLFSHSTDEIEKTWSRLKKMIWITGREKYLSLFPPKNLEGLKAYTDYYGKRVELHKNNFGFRIWAAVQLLFDYFRFGLGLRSLIRDLLIK